MRWLLLIILLLLSVIGPTVGQKQDMPSVIFLSRYEKIILVLLEL